MNPEPKPSTLTFARARLQRLPPARVFELRARPGAPLLPALGPRLGAQSGLQPADHHGAVTLLTGGRLLWQRPGGWFAVAEDDALASLLAGWCQTPPQAGWHAFDLSAARTAFLFRGADVLALLSRAGPVHEALPTTAPACTRLRLAQLSVLVETRLAGGALEAVAWLESSQAAWWWAWWQTECTLEPAR